jgi:hypothetical protein
MANTRKQPKRKKVNRRRVRQTPEPLSKLDQHYIALHSCYKAARKAGFTAEHAFWLMTEGKTFPNWIVGDGGIIPTIDPTDDEDDD